MILEMDDIKIGEILRIKTWDEIVSDEIAHTKDEEFYYLHGGKKLKVKEKHITNFTLAPINFSFPGRRIKLPPNALKKINKFFDVPNYFFEI